MVSSISNGFHSWRCWNVRRYKYYSDRSESVSNPVDAITITYTDNDTIASIKEKIRDVKNLSSSTVIRLENVNKTELSDAAQVLRHASRGDTVYWNTEQDSRPSNRTGASFYSISIFTIPLLIKFTNGDSVVLLTSV